MPFRGDRTLEERIRDRAVGPLAPPNPGITQSEDGTIVGSMPGLAIPPGNEVKVNFPGPREPVLDGRGVMSPRWYRFFEELYRRTGGVYDNVNVVNSRRILPPEVGSITLTGQVPLVSILVSTESGSVELSGQTPIISRLTLSGAGSLALIGQAPTIS